MSEVHAAAAPFDDAFTLGLLKRLEHELAVASHGDDEVDRWPARECHDQEHLGRRG